MTQLGQKKKPEVDTSCRMRANFKAKDDLLIAQRILVNTVKHMKWPVGASTPKATLKNLPE